MKTLTRGLALISVIVAVRALLALTPLDGLCPDFPTTALAGTAAAEDEGTLSADQAVQDVKDKKRQRTQKIIVVSIFGVFLILGVYWWTYGKLHHKLPRY